MTCVPVVSFVRSRVVPAGTATLFKTMVAQAALDLTADAALVKVQVVARSASAARGVGAGAAGAALAKEIVVAKRLRMVWIWTILAEKLVRMIYYKELVLSVVEKRMRAKVCECSMSDWKKKNLLDDDIGDLLIWPLYILLIEEG